MAHENGDVEQAHYRFKRGGGPGAARAGQPRVSPTVRPTTRFLQDLVTTAQPDPPGALGRGAGGAAPAARGAAGAVPRGARAGQPLQHHPGAAQHLLGAVAADRHDAAGAGARRDAGGLPRHGAPADDAAAARAAASIASTTATSSGRWCASRAPSPSTATATICSRRSIFRRAYDALRAQHRRSAPIASTCGCCTWRPAPPRARSRPALALLLDQRVAADLRRRARPGARARPRSRCPTLSAGRCWTLAVYDRLLGREAAHA